MKKVYDIDFYGKATYNKKLKIWKSITPIEILFNGKNCSLDFYIEDASPLITESNISLKNITLDPYFTELEQKRILKQKQLFDKYIKNQNDMAEIFGEGIIEDFVETKEIMFDSDRYREKYFEVETIEKIRTADTPEKIFDMIHFKELTLAVNQIRIIGKCDYYCIDYGVSITSNGTVYAGSVEMIYC